MCACAASNCCCSGLPSARWTPFACTLCSSILPRWTFPRTLRPVRRPSWSASRKRPWPMCWRPPTPTRISVLLRICMTGAAQTRPRAVPCGNCIISAGRCLIRPGRCKSLPLCGRATCPRRTRLGGAICCASLWPVHRVPKNCWRQVPASLPGTTLPMPPTRQYCKKMPTGWNGFARHCKSMIGTLHWEPWRNWPAAGAKRVGSKAARTPTRRPLQPASCGTGPKSR